MGISDSITTYRKGDFNAFTWAFVEKKNGSPRVRLSTFPAEIAAKTLKDAPSTQFQVRRDFATTCGGPDMDAENTW